MTFGLLTFFFLLCRPPNTKGVKKFPRGPKNGFFLFFFLPFTRRNFSLFNFFSCPACSAQHSVSLWQEEKSLLLLLLFLSKKAKAASCTKSVVAVGPSPSVSLGSQRPTKPRRSRRRRRSLSRGKKEKRSRGKRTALLGPCFPRANEGENEGHERKGRSGSRIDIYREATPFDVALG